MSLIEPKKPFQKFRGGSVRGGRRGRGGSGGRGGRGGRPFNKFHKDGNRKFLQNAKGFGKKGNFGRGTHIEEEEFTYFIGILQAQNQTNPELWEEKVAMANNVMEQTKGKEISLSSNQLVSKVLENLLGFVDYEHLERYFEVFGEGLRPICSDIYSSHVIQKLMDIALIRAVGNSAEEDGSSKPKKAKEIMTELNYNMIHDFPESHRTKCAEFFVRMSKFLLNNLEDFVFDSIACYLIQSAILGLAGVHIPKTVVNNGKVIKPTDKFNGILSFHRNGEFKLVKTVFKVPEEWAEILMEFPNRLQMWPQFKDLPYQHQTSVLIQVICIALNTANKKALDAFGTKLINDAFIDVEIPKTALKNHYSRNGNEDNDAKNGEEGEANGNGVEEKLESGDEGPKEENDEKEEEDEKVEEEEKEKEEEDDDKEMPSVFKTDSSVRLFQSLIAVASPKLLTKIYALFKDRLLSLEKSKFGHFAIQRFVNYVSEKSQFEAIFDEFCPHFERLLTTNKAFLVTSLSATCLRLKTRQAALITALQNTLHCNASLGEDRPKAFFNCLAKMKPFESLPYDRKIYLGMIGSLIIQDILQFNKPIFLVNSILETENKTLVEILQCPKGSFIADKFLSSPTIGEKSREKFVKLFEGFYLDLAISQGGSRAIELFVKVSSDAQKVVIAKELLSKENKLKGNQYGRILYYTLKLETLKLSPEQWKATLALKPKSEAVEKAETSEEMETTSPSPKKNKKNKEEPVEMETTEETETTSPKKNKKNKKNKKRPAS